jgi:hypothetical protein
MTSALAPPRIVQADKSWRGLERVVCSRANSGVAVQAATP